MNLPKTMSFLAVACAALISLAMPAASARADNYQSVAVPAYFYPPSYWAQMIKGAPTVSLAIANPDSGPGSASDPNYVTVIQQAQKAGTTIIGYVNTANGNTLIPLATVESQIDDYMNWYDVDGIFLDDARCTTANETYYTTLKNYVKSYFSTATVVLNPGSEVTDSNYGKIADVLVTFEGTYSDYHSTSSSNYSRYIAASWYKNYPYQKFWHIIFDCTSIAKMQSVVTLSESRRAGYVYVTTDTLPNPYDTLPGKTYFNDELAQVKAF